MGKVTRRSVDQEQTPKPQRKRRKRDLDRIHSKILRAKRKLDDVGKGDNEAGQKKRNHAKICNRLLPEPVAGIYRNGAKGKDIQKAETVENTFRKARLKADALKLFNGDTHGSKCIVEIPIHDKTGKQSPNNDCLKNSMEWTPCMLEQSPVLGKPSRNQKPCLIKKKGEENIFEDTYSNKIKQNVNDKSRHGHKENICKRRLFQNDKEQLETMTNISTTKIFDNSDLTKENKTREKETEQTCSKNSMDSFCAPLNRYMEFCKIISAQNFETDILQNYHSDPVTTTIKKLRRAYADSFHRQLLRQKNKQELENVKPAHSVDYQACTSDILQLSPVEFEVPKCSENHNIAVSLQEGSSSQRNDKFHLTQHADFKKSDDITYHSSTSCSSRNTFTIYDTNDPIVENFENNDTQRSKQSKDIRQRSKSMNFYFMKDKDSIQVDSQKNSNYVNHLSKNKRHDKDNFSISIPGYKNLRCIDNSIQLRTILNDSLFSKRHFIKDYSHEKLPIAVSANYVPSNVSQKCNNRTTNKRNMKNVKRVPTILRRYSNTVDKSDHSIQITDNYAEGLYKKSETNLFRNPNNSIDKELYKPVVLSNELKNRSSNTINMIFDQTKILEPEIGSMKIKDSQESQIEQFDINMHPKKQNEKNRFYRYDGSLYPRTSETSYNTNVYSENLPQQDQVSPDMRKHLFHSNNYRPINHLQGVNFSNSDLEPTKEFPQRTKLHICETNKEPLIRKNTCNQNIHFSNVNDRAIPMPNFSQNIPIEKRSTESCRKLFDKTDVECAKKQINQSTCHCNEQYIYFDSANCPRKSKEQAHYLKETSQPESLCDTRGCNDNIDNCINLPNTMRNVPLLSLKQKNLYAYPKAIDDQHETMLLQNVTQPVKYLAVKSGSDIQRIPVYINDRNVRIAEDIPLKVIALIDPSSQTKAFPREIATQAIPLETDNLHDFATRKVSEQSFVKHLNSVNAILFKPDSQSNIWYASNL